MAITNINPLQNSVLGPADSFTFDIDNTYTALVIKVAQSGGDEYAYDYALGGAQAGYTVAIEVLASDHRITVTRDAGWNKEPTTVSVTENESGASTTTSFSYYLTSTAVYPEGMQPYSDAYEGSLIITEGDIQVRGDVGWIDYDENDFNVTDMGNGKVKVETVAGVGGADTFLELTDTESNYNGLTGSTVVVTGPDENGDTLSFTDSYPRQGLGEWTYNGGIGLVNAQGECDYDTGVYEFFLTNNNGDTYTYADMYGLEGHVILIAQGKGTGTRYHMFECNNVTNGTVWFGLEVTRTIVGSQDVLVTEGTVLNADVRIYPLYAYNAGAGGAGGGGAGVVLDMNQTGSTSQGQAFIENVVNWADVTSIDLAQLDSSGFDSSYVFGNLVANDRITVREQNDPGVGGTFKIVSVGGTPGSTSTNLTVVAESTNGVVGSGDATFVPETVQVAADSPIGAVGYGSWTYDNSSTSPVGMVAGDMRFDDANPMNAENIYIHGTNDQGTGYYTGDISGLENLKDYFISLATETTQMVVRVNDTPFYSSGAITIPAIMWADAVGSPGANGAPHTLTVMAVEADFRARPIGEASYTWSNDTTPDIAGEFYAPYSSYLTTSTMSFYKDDTYGVPFRETLLELSYGALLRIRTQGDLQDRALTFRVFTVTDNTTYVTLSGETVESDNNANWNYNANLSVNIISTSGVKVSTATPGSGQDNTEGYVPGSVWIESDAADAYICISNGTGAAVWKKTTP